MSLPAPQLDDRDWDDLVEEAKRRIAAKCPNWTDFNPSDAGMTLVELMAWMTETALYRLNRVPEKNYIKFLELIGLRLQPARPARTWVFFEVRKDAKEESIKPVPADTRISTQPQREQEPVTFATSDNLHLTTARIIKTGSRYSPSPTGSSTVISEVEEIHNLHDDNPWETEIFHPSKKDPQRAKAVPHILYLGDEALGDPLLVKYWKETQLRILVEVEKPMSGQLFLEWEAWDGERWQPVIPDEDTTQGLRSAKGHVRFERLPTMKQLDLAQLSRGQLAGPAAAPGQEVGPLWLRARLIGSTVEELPVIRTVQRQIDLKECVVPPLKAFAETPPPPVPLLQPLEINADFQPLGTKVVPGSAFYLVSELFQKRGATIAIQFGIRKGLQPQAANMLEIHWEYKHRSGEWRTLGRTTPGGVTTSDYQLQDETQAFTRNGKVKFLCPDEITPTELAGQTGWFIRARVERAVFENDRHAQLVAHSVLLGFSQETRPWRHRVSENYSLLQEHPAGRPFAPFRVEKPQDPAFYICLNKQPSPQRGPYWLFLDVVPQEIEPWEPEIRREATVTQRWIWRPEESVIKPRGARMIWEYHSTDGWKSLKVGTDGTEGFAHEGTVDFFSPEDWRRLRDFDVEGYWLRVRWEIAEFLKPPRLRRVLLNGVAVEQTTRKEQVLGSSTGQPDQSFSHGTSILDRPQIWIRESDTSSDEEFAALKQKTEAEVEKHPDGIWVQWTEVRNFLHSKATDRHFTADLENGTFTFGDDRHGMIPPEGRDNVEAWSRVTLGAKGNVGSNTITVLEKSLEQVQGVKNVLPAEGGTDPESIEKAKQRGPWDIKHGSRAVTREDFIALAKKASPLVGKVECYEDHGTIHVIIVPNDKGEKPQPSRRLIEDVSSYLDDKRLINTRVKVQGLVYEAIEVEVAVVLEALFLSRFLEVREEIEKKLRNFVHPLTGMDDGCGWPMGRTVHKSELYYLLENIKGVDHIQKLQMRRSETKPWEDNIRIGDRSFPWFSEMSVKQAFS